MGQCVCVWWTQMENVGCDEVKTIAKGTKFVEKGKERSRPVQINITRKKRSKGRCRVFTALQP